MGVLGPWAAAPTVVLPSSSVKTCAGMQRFGGRGGQMSALDSAYLQNTLLCSTCCSETLPQLSALARSLATVLVQVRAAGAAAGAIGASGSESLRRGGAVCLPG